MVDKNKHDLQLDKPVDLSGSQTHNTSNEMKAYTKPTLKIYPAIYECIAGGIGPPDDFISGTTN